MIMHIPVYPSISLALSTTAFGALNYSDTLNDLTSRITGGRVTRNMLAEAVLHQAIGLGLGIARDHKAVDKYAKSMTGISGAKLIEYADKILRSANDEQFSASVRELLTQTLKKQTAAGHIPDTAQKPAIDLAATLLNDYIGKQAIYQFLGAYAQKHGWDVLSEKIKNAVVPEQSDSYRNLLILAGIDAGTDFIRSLVDRAILQNPAFRQGKEFHAKPELKLAAGCLHAYLVNPENCIEAFNNYTPTKPLIDATFLRNVADLTMAFAAQAHSDADNVLKEAQKKLDEENAKSSLQTRSPGPALQMQVPEPAAAQSDVDEEIADFLLVDASDDGFDENKGASGSSAKTDVDKGIVSPNDSSKEVVDIDGFVKIDTNAQIAVRDAKKACEQAEKVKVMCDAIGALLVADMDTRNAEHIEGAVKILLEALPFGSRLESASFTKKLSEATELPAQSLIGTYAAIYKWEGLETLLATAIEKNLEHMEKKAVERAAKKAEYEANALKAQQAAQEYAVELAQANPNTENAALAISEPRPEQETQQAGTAAKDPKKPPVQDDQRTENKEPSPVRRAIPALAAKLVVQHLRPYIEKGKLERPDNPEYKTLADLLHANQNELHGGFSTVQVGLNSATIVAQYVTQRAPSGVKYVGSTALSYASSAAQYAGNAAVSYVSSAAQTGAAVVSARAQTIGEQIMAAGGFANALTSPAVKVVATGGGFVAGLWNRFNPFAAAPDQPVAAEHTRSQDDTLSTSVLAAGI